MIRIEQMTCAHVGAVAALESLCFRDPWSVNSISGELDNPLSLWLVAMSGEKLVGYVGSQSVMGEADMMNLAVVPGFRRMGVGRRLIQALTEQLCEQQVRSLTLEVRASNDAAIQLYDSMSFLRVGRRPNYYRNPREDALILRKEWAL